RRRKGAPGGLDHIPPTANEAPSPLDGMVGRVGDALDFKDALTAARPQQFALGSSARHGAEPLAASGDPQIAQLREQAIERPLGEIAGNEGLTLSLVQGDGRKVESKWLAVGVPQALDPLDGRMRFEPEPPSGSLPGWSLLDSEHPARLDETGGGDRLGEARGAENGGVQLAVDDKGSAPPAGIQQSLAPKTANRLAHCCSTDTKSDGEVDLCREPLVEF